MSRRAWRVLPVLLAVVWSLPAQHPDAGTTVFRVLSMNFAAREVAMAGASVAMPNGLGGFYANPAALGYIETMQALMGYRSVLLDVWGGMVAFGLPMDRYGVWSINAVDLSGGSVDEVIADGTGTPLETGVVWKDNSVAGGLSWSKVVWTTLSVGASVKGVYQRISSSNDARYSADGVAVDAGVQYRLPDTRFVTGLAIRNLGFLRSGFSRNDNDYRLPFGVGLGVSYVPRYTPALRVALDLEKALGEYLRFEPALELAAYRKLLFVRLGYAFSERDAEEGFRTLTGEPDETYQKSDWSALCLGLGVNSEIGAFRVEVDAALEFRVDVQPAFVVTTLVGF
jgi:hypothetical protein